MSAVSQQSQVVDNIQAARSAPLLVRLGRHFRRYGALWLMVLPTLIFVGLFAYVPMYGLRLAFYNFDPAKGLMGGTFAGMKYFNQFFKSGMFVNILTNTLRISLWTLVMGFIAPIILALLINQIASTKIKSFVQTVTYMPHFISTVVIVSMINIFLAPNTGMIGRLFPNTNLLAKADLFTPIYWITEVWQHMGWNCIIYLAALSSVDLALYEAAKIDGAGRLQLIRYVDIPTILPTVGIMLIMNMGSVLNVGFEKVFLMQNSMNLSASEVISTYTYRIGILGNQFSYSTAIGLFNTVVNFFFLVLANFISKRASDTSIF
ncbi:ABC transporter permease [Bifidobacterium moukalabense]|jgi:putative aldouronate transport system permease protein|uniref:Binding-protein-dependent transport system inner membrane protein n=1 Tax=Bifidobacterium moukalabense DSM 27321 TaxID=1435051 RepID=W4NBF1_9BIFI|nr:ABC transporter permease subunit [Bifidobacterium moukalabense]ETY71811.1 binding-protein-dependent transport system inner membrane protein [Bifidobacterium moukalabense DSM 27321]